MTTPLIYWSQDKTTIKIFVQIKDVFKPPLISFDEKHLKLVPEASQVENENQILDKLEFYDLVVPNASYFRIRSSEIIYEILKYQPQYWPNLVKSNQNCILIKNDDIFNKFPNMLVEETESSNPINQLSLENSFRVVRSNKNFGRRKKKSITPYEVKKIFFFLYNLFQFVGFLYVFVVLLIRYAKEGTNSTAQSYRTLRFVIKFLYITQIFEVIHSLKKILNRNTFFMLLHLMFRYFILFIIIDEEPRIQSEESIFYLLLVYALIELFKYPYYILILFYVNINFLSYLRSMVNFILYPIVFLTEGTVLFKGLPYFEKTQKFSLKLPNQLNFSFSLTAFIRCYLLLNLFPFMYLTLARLYFHRLNHSKKILL